jgi:rhodanese-related sulfurtransferase
VREAPRIKVEEARQKILSGKSLLVCAYDDDARFNRLRLDGAVPLKEFQANVGELSKDKEIIFYCA